MRLRSALPHADIARVVTGCPSVLVDDEYAVLGALSELRNFMPDPLVQYLVQEEPSLVAGGLSLARLGELHNSWREHGAPALGEFGDDELRGLLLGPRADGPDGWAADGSRRWQHYVNNFIVGYYSNRSY